MTFKPMLACKAPSAEEIQYPVLASPKLDGIRCTIQGGVALSRTLKPIPNRDVQGWVASFDGALDGLDGELVVGVHDDEVFRRTTSFVMSKDKVGEDWALWVFDYRLDSIADDPFHSRFNSAIHLIESELASPDRLCIVPHKKVWTPEELAAFEGRALRHGYEGAMVRDPDGPYKNGRSTPKQGWLLKIKQFLDDEAEIIGYEERTTNENQRTLDEMGKMSRSSHQAGLIPAGDLGAFLCRNKEGVEFSVGSGYSAAERVELWGRRKELSSGGKYLKYQYFNQGVKEKPRFPTYKGLRDRMDFD